MSESRPDETRKLDVSGARVALVAARYNADIVDRLVRGAREALAAHGIAPTQVELVEAPGAWELPLVAAHLASQDRFDAIIALGAVIRGGTAHFEFVCSGCTQGLMQVQLEFGVPIGFGVLTCDTEKQALDRAGDGRGNKGREAALAALEMIATLRRLDVGS
jgi:6,7-dimethyl-8-ribityllumazine synthase